MIIKYESIEQLLKKGEESLNVEFKDIDKHNRLKAKKGGIGQMIEESHFEYQINSNSAPDFENLETELKVTPFTKGKNKYIAKERLVLSIINYMNENWEDFFKSHFWYKNHQLLIEFYENEKDKEKQNWSIKKQILYTYPTEDLIIIMKDWETISNKVKIGKADEISEGDTYYLGACTKGKNAESSLRPQPFSNKLAKQRAYCLKQSYMTYLLNKYVFGNEINEHIVKNASDILNMGLEGYIINKIRPYIGKSRKELMELLKIDSNCYSINAMIINKILETNGNLRNTNEFIKANIIPKTIRIEANGSIKESMSFSPFKFKDLINQNWEDSDLYSYLSSTKFMFIIFQKIESSEDSSYLKSIKFWNVPTKDLQIIKHNWERTKEVIKNRINLTPYTNKKGVISFHNNLPKSNPDFLIHVRPHSAKAAYLFDDVCIGNIKDANELPDGRWMTTQSFWFNNSYIRKIIK